MEKKLNYLLEEPEEIKLLNKPECVISLSWFNRFYARVVKHDDVSHLTGNVRRTSLTSSWNPTRFCVKLQQRTFGDE